MPTDPNGSEDLELAVLGSASRGDPELARWVAQVQGLLRQHFRPLAQGQDLHCWMHVDLDPESGRIRDSEVLDGGSGVAAFDMAAQRAVEEMGTLPAPPAKFAKLIAAEGVKIEFVPPR
jgi:hypothetical protein